MATRKDRLTAEQEQQLEDFYKAFFLKDRIDIIESSVHYDCFKEERKVVQYMLQTFRLRMYFKFDHITENELGIVNIKIRPSLLFKGEERTREAFEKRYGYTFNYITNQIKNYVPSINMKGKITVE